MDRNSDWIYYGVFLREQDRERIAKEVDRHVIIPDGWKMFVDHMTLVFNTHTQEARELASYYKDKVREKSGMVVTHIGFSDNAIAVKVKYSDRIANTNPHVTVAIRPGHKPVESNNITQWTKIDPFYVVGTIDAVMKNCILK